MPIVNSSTQHNTPTEYNKMKLNKIQAGLYFVKVGDGPLDRYQVECIQTEFGSEWFLTYPGDHYPCDVYPTLRAARNDIENHIGQAA
jgi:hypothetical protein